jgi:Methionyl-tRNA synthetase
MSGSKASTSRGHAIWVKDFLDRYEPDALRYYLTAAGPETQDSDFTWEEFVRARTTSCSPTGAISSTGPS